VAKALAVRVRFPAWSASVRSRHLPIEFFRRAVEFGLSVKRETASAFKPRTIGQPMDSHLASCPSFSFFGWAAVLRLSN